MQSRKIKSIKHWAGGLVGPGKAHVSDEFQALQEEMKMRHEGMENLKKSMSVYTKSLSCRSKTDSLPLSDLGETMKKHGRQLDQDSEFGKCLDAMGRSNERLARYQEGYIQDAKRWSDALDRSLAMMTEYQAARKKLDSRKSAYDASLSKMQKAKKEDFRYEEDLRLQKANYEESTEDVFRRMQDIKEAEVDSVRDLGAFLNAELGYYEKCRDELQRLKESWPARTVENNDQGPANQSQTNITQFYNERLTSRKAEPRQDPEPRALGISAYNGGLRKPGNVRASTFQGPTFLKEPPSFVHQGSMPTTNHTSRIPAQKITSGYHSDDSTVDSASPVTRSVSPATSEGSVDSRKINYNAPATGARKAPPPPPNRATKPAVPNKKPNLSSGS